MAGKAIPYGEPNAPHVTIVLGLCDGVPHLGPQLHSYLEQTLQPRHVLASDDSTGTETRQCFETYAQNAPDWQTWDLRIGPKAGVTANFLSLLAQVDAEQTDYVALSDQDDIWMADKLHSAVLQIKQFLEQHPTPETHPVLLGCRSWEWSPTTQDPQQGEAQDNRHLSRHVPPPYDFDHALMQNFAGGNTMVLNRAALKLIQQALPDMPLPTIHDWFIYQLITGAGGSALFDSTPHLLYRQHSSNVIGANSNWSSKFMRFGMMLQGTYRKWMTQNIAALDSCRPLLTPQAQALLQRLKQDRDKSLFKRLHLLWGTGLHRKGYLNQSTLWIAAILRKI